MRHQQVDPGTFHSQGFEWGHWQLSPSVRVIGQDHMQGWMSGYAQGNGGTIDQLRRRVDGPPSWGEAGPGGAML